MKHSDMAEDYYKILGIKKNASAADIQKAYRDLARKYHPDMNPNDKGAKAKFQKLQEAYDVLGNAEKREMYDRYGSSFESMGRGSAPTGTGGPGFGDFDFHTFFGGRGATGGGPVDFSELFKQFSGGEANPQSRQGRGRNRRSAARGADAHHQVEIPFQTAISGGEIALTVQRDQHSNETINVKIPAGIEDGQAIRLRGQGDESSGRGIPGDLLVTIKVSAHPYFRRHGSDLEVDVPVSIFEALVGARVDVPTPKGTIALKVPPNTSSGKKLRIKGHGVPKSGSEAGDLYAVIQLVLPDKLSDADATSLKRMSEHYSMNPRAGLRW